MKRAITVVLFLFSSFIVYAQKPLVSQVVAGTVSLFCTPGVPGQGQAVPVGFNFYRSSVTGGPYTLLGTSPMTSSCSYTDTTVAPNNTYFYVATDLSIAPGGTCPTGQVCESTFSNETKAIVPPLGPPPPPTALTVGTIVAKTVPLNWNAPTVADGYTFENYIIYKGSKPTLPNPAKIGITVATNFKATGCIKTSYFEVKAQYVDNKNNTVISGPSNIALANCN